MLPSGLNGMLEGVSAVASDGTEFLEAGASCSLEGGAEVLRHKLFKIPCFISSAADSLGDFSCSFSTCFRAWVYTTCHVFLMLKVICCRYIVLLNWKEQVFICLAA